MNGLPKLRIPRKFSKFTLIDTSDSGRTNETDIDPEIQSVALAPTDAGADTDAEDSDTGCVGWLRSKWYWRHEREERNRKKIISQIKQDGEKIDKHESTLVDIEESLKKCKQSKNKQRARLLLLKRKRLRNTIKSYYNSRAELEQVLISLEESSDQLALVKSYKTANSILKTTMRQRGGQSAVETFEDLADDLQEAQDDVHELQEAVSRNIGRSDDELSAELEELFEDSPKIKPTASSGNPPPHTKIARPTQEHVLRDLQDLQDLPLAPLPEAPRGSIELTDEQAIKDLEDLEAPLAV